MNKLVVISREKLLTLIAEEKNNFSKYVQLCSNYQIQPDPLASARHQGKIEILQLLMQEKN